MLSAMRFRAGMFVLLAAALAGAPLTARQSNRIDTVTPMAPDLAAYGPSAVGVRTVSTVDRGRVDVLGTMAGGATARADRPLTLEIWYPAALAAGQAAGGEYRTIARDPAMPVVLRGRAVRNAAPAAGGPYPLVVISHGYPGNRLLMSHLGENLASKGYVVASIDHTDSTYADAKAFASTLYNLSYANNASILVELDGASCPGCAGITLSTFSAGVRGLAIHSFLEQVVIAGGGAVQGCYLGTDASGSTVKPNGLSGARIGASSFGQVGGPNLGDGNLIVNQVVGIAVTMLGLLAFLVLNERGDRARLAVAPAAAAEPFQGTARLDARPEPA